jgi:hypothetical protein
VQSDGSETSRVEKERDLIDSLKPECNG